jgi:hypothetical protein
MDKPMTNFIPAAVTFVERRNVTLRNKRDAVAEWLGVHPSELAALDSATVDAMVSRLKEEARVARVQAGAKRSRSGVSTAEG